MVYSSGYWKRQAREALRNHWLTALLIALIVNLPSLLVQALAAMTGNDLMTRVQEVLYGAITATGTQVDAAKLQSGLQEIQSSSGIWVMQGLNILAWLLTPCLTLGMVSWMLGRLRKQEDPGVGTVFSQVKRFFAGIGLRLYTAWRVFLFMLPGVALCVLAMVPVWTSNSSSQIALYSAVNTAMGLETAAVIVTVVLGIIAALKYALGDMFLADHGDWGPVRAAKESREATKGKKGQLCLLYMSFIFWYLLEMMVTSLCLDFFGSIPALMVEMLASLALTVYVNCSICAFYLDGHQPQEQETTAEEPEISI